MPQSHKIVVEGSSNLDHFDYDPNEKKLVVQFLNGTAYVYKDVPIEQYDALKAAAIDPDTSTGKHFNTNIKGNFEFERLT